MKVTKLGALAVGASLVLGACSQGASTAPGSGGVATKGTVNIAIELPQQGSDLASSEPMINGIKLAVKDAGGVAGSYKVEIPNSAIFDDAKDGAHDPQTGAQNMQAIVALEIRKAHPDKINYIRVVTTDDNQGPAAAKYILDNLKKKNVYIIDDTETFGKVIADNFQKYLEANGGTVVARDGVPKTTTDYSAILTAAKAKNPEAIY